MKSIFLLMVMLLASAQARPQLSLDELGDLRRCHYQLPRCQPSEFNCRCEDDATGESRECIPQSWVCDGQQDCSNGADEIDCRCVPGEYQCYDGVGMRFYQCIDESRVCDGELDCVNRRDDYSEKCGGGFQCKNGRYIPASWRCDGYDDCGDNSDEDNCDDDIITSKHKCDCYKEGNDTCGNIIRCYHDDERCDGFANCPDGSDEWNCPSSCPSWLPYNCACNKINDFSCEGTEYVCYKHDERCDGYTDCPDSSDEWNCPSSCPSQRPNNCACNNDYYCNGNGRICYEHDERCDGYTVCPDGSDEWNCPSSCPSQRPNNCACNKIDTYSCKRIGRICYEHDERCDTRKDCQDSSDEMNCSCPEGKFTCPCFRKNYPTCNIRKGCIPMKYVNDGKLDCDNRNDEQYIKSWEKLSWGSCNFDVIRLENESFCIPPWCDNSTCTNVPSLECSKYDCNMTDAVCFSFCSDTKTSTSNANKVFQCTDQSIILDQNFCNGKEDCNDGTDEITSQPGFKCSAKFSTILCVLPQWNLYDDIAQCYDNSDICFSSDGSFHCFKCVDNRLIISPKQVCDGVIDCFDLSDECLCENPSLPECLDVFSRSSQCNFFKFWNIESNDGSNTLSSLQIDKDLINCKNKQGDTFSVQCDGRPECLDFSDECKSCTNPPAFCNDTCRTYFPMGDRYCDGYIDEAWKYLQDTNCSEGFDEKICF
ncbi:uncharacterized protein LOC143465528 isoform X2 [Clavelina lepadiformis]|uniref:uncharacterized protein LOC143465528 isoform X2 n=1 Tax=Clavelina lepadiformis TaxID=159417 RepID=UPI004042C563